MQTNQNNVLFADISREFVVRFVDLMARILHRKDSVDFDLNDLTEDADALIFEICFFGIASFEEQSGFDRNDQRYTPRPAFETLRDGRNEILLGDTIVHGLIGDETLAEGIALARSKI